MSKPDKYPVIAVGAVVFHQGKVLLVQRRHPPNQEQWAIPGGKVRLGETLQAAAEREILEETGIRIRAGKAVYSFELIERDTQGHVVYHYVIIDLLAEYLAGEPQAADDATAADWIESAQFKTLPVNMETRKLLQQQFNFGSH